MNRLPTDSAERKKIALDALFDYFGDALCEVAKVISAGQAQHNTQGWDRTKSTDHDACLLRHFMDRGSLDIDGMSHRAKMAWRALAGLQLEVENRRGLLPPRGVSVWDDASKLREDRALMNIAPPAEAVPDAPLGFVHVLAPARPEQLELPFTGKQLAVKEYEAFSLAQPTEKVDYSKPVQLELPFTGKQLAIVQD